MSDKVTVLEVVPIGPGGAMLIVPAGEPPRYFTQDGELLRLDNIEAVQTFLTAIKDENPAAG